jgi:alkylresorcinol/alkylpyrone synthase
MALEDFEGFLFHPGGRKVLETAEEVLGIERRQIAYSWDVLRDYGNQSSASVLFVLDEWLRTRQVRRGGYGMLAAFGPGFSAETALLEWD